MSKEQHEAATWGLGPVLISAGPGSGKTFTITHRILYLIQELRCSPQDIYVITFTKDAAHSMSRRYQEILQDMKEKRADMSAVHFGTFHSFFYQIIRSYPKYKNYSLINSSGKSGILFRVLKNRGQDILSGKDLQTFLGDMSFFKNTGKLREGLGEDFLELVNEYDREKDKEHLLDFDDMLTLCYRILHEDETLRRIWQKRVRYLLVDEFQDTNAVQYEVIKLLLKEPYNICVVGDDDQAIYGFRGSQPGIMNRFLEDFPEAKHISLGTNYRCTGEIVKISSKMIGKNTNRISKQLRAKDVEADANITIKGFDSYLQMVKGCVEELKSVHCEKLTEIAVLFRTNVRMNLFLVELLKNRIAFQTKEKLTSVYEHFVVKDVMDYLKAASGCVERNLFLRILNKPRTHIGREALFDEQVDLERIISFYGEQGMRNYVAMNDAIRFHKGLENLKRLKLSLGIEFILRYFGYETYLRNKACGDMQLYEEWMGILSWLKEDAKGFRDVAQWERFQQEYIYKAQETPKADEKKGGVHVMTLHGCKGLEFERVYIMHVNEGNIPNVKRGENLTQEHLEEERRLFYVGITRAKEALDILYVNQTQENPKPPSRFIKELQD